MTVNLNVQFSNKFHFLSFDNFLLNCPGLNTTGPWSGLDIKHLVYMPIRHVVLKIYVPCKNVDVPSQYLCKPCKAYIYCWKNKYIARLKNHLPSWTRNHKSLCPLGQYLHAPGMRARLNVDLCARIYSIHWFWKWLGAIRHQAITWTNDDWWVNTLVLKFNDDFTFSIFLFHTKLTMNVEIHSKQTHQINSLQPSDGIGQQRFGSTLAQVMASCLIANKFLLMRFGGIHVRAISQPVPKLLFSIMSLKSILLKCMISSILITWHCKEPRHHQTCYWPSFPKYPGCHLNMNMLSYQYRDPHVKDKMV